MEKFEIKDLFELDVKRLHLPIIIKKECPNCKRIIENDLNDNYLNYPTVNEKESMYFHCDHCATEFEVDAVLKISVEVDSEIRLT